MKRSSPLTTVGWGEKAPRAENGSRPAELLLRIVDCGLIGVICIAPFFFGGRHDLGRLVIVTLIALTAAAWFMRQAMLRSAGWPRTIAFPLLFVAAALLVVQMLPLPPAWIESLSPGTGELLPLWKPGSSEVGSLGTWQTLSLIPHETAKSLAMLLSYSLLFAVVAGRIQSVSDVQRIQTWVAVAAVLMAGFGLLQYFTSDGRYFWFFAHPYRSAAQNLSGAFINRNHFAHFLILGIGPLIACWMHIAAQPRRVAVHEKTPTSAAHRLAAWMVAAALSLVVAGILGSHSRGGAIVMLVAGAVLVAIYLYRGVADSRFVYGLVGLAVVVVGLLSLYGYDQVVQRLDDFAEGSLDEIDHGGIRRKIWAANAAAIEAFPLTGVGAGSHREICPVYLPESLINEYTHAENGYLQVATETGAGGVILLFVGIAVVGSWCLGCLRHAKQAADIRWFGAAAAGLAASLAHSAVDFVWYIPACMSVTIVLAASVLRLSQLAREPGRAPAGVRILRRGRWLELAVASLLIGAWSIHTCFGPAVAAVHWDRYRRASVADSQLAQQTIDQFVAGEGIAPQDSRRSLSQTMLRHLESAVYWDPSFARAHKRLADRYMAEFEYRVTDAANVLDVTQIRDAAMASSFTSAEELQAWLERAFGPDVALLRRALTHARRSLELCPLQGDAYLHLADLSFLDLSPRAAMEAYVDQALAVRPYDRNVLAKAGLQALVTGRVDVAIEHWAKCFNTPGRHQQEITYRLVASGMPAKEFVASFQPKWRTLRQIWAQYRKFGERQDLNDILTYATNETQRETSAAGGVPAAYVWFWQSGLYADVGRRKESLACLERAYACDPRQYFIRHRLATAMQAAGRLAEAEPHVRWCLARRPADKSLGSALVTIAKARYAQRDTVRSAANDEKSNSSQSKPAGGLPTQPTM